MGGSPPPDGGVFLVSPEEMPEHPKALPDSEADLPPTLSAPVPFLRDLWSEQSFPCFTHQEGQQMQRELLEVVSGTTTAILLWTRQSQTKATLLSLQSGWKKGCFPSHVSASKGLNWANSVPKKKNTYSFSSASSSINVSQSPSDFELCSPQGFVHKLVRADRVHPMLLPPVSAASAGMLSSPDIISKKDLAWAQHRDRTRSAACSANIYQHHLNVIYSCIPKEGCGRLGSFDN